MQRFLSSRGHGHLRSSLHSSTVRPSSTTTTIEQQPIPPILPKFLRQYVGNGHLFRCLIPYEATYPRTIGVVNSVYHIAPVSKWGLTIVPLMGIMAGTDRVETIDVRTNVSLIVTGMIWACYTLLIRPQNVGSRMCCAVNCAVVVASAYNLWRYWQWQLAEQDQAQLRLTQPEEVTLL